MILLTSKKCLVVQNNVELICKIETNKYLNVIGGARILDTLSEQEVEEIVYNQLVKYFDLKINRTVKI